MILSSFFHNLLIFYTSRTVADLGDELGGYTPLLITSRNTEESMLWHKWHWNINLSVIFTLYKRWWFIPSGVASTTPTSFLYPVYYSNFIKFIKCAIKLILTIKTQTDNSFWGFCNIFKTTFNIIVFLRGCTQHTLDNYTYIYQHYYYSTP